MRRGGSVAVVVVAVAWLGSGCSESKPDCLGDAVVCGGSCAELRSDNQNCGACGNACAAGQVCSAGRCAQTCAPAQAACPPASPTFCADTSRDANHCGGCGVACAAGQQCAGSTCACPAARPNACGTGGSAFCTDFKGDPLNCGACGATCGAGRVCSNGACALTCGAAEASACPAASPTYCADISRDANNCGGCGVACAAGQQCAGSTCACPAARPNACGTGAGAMCTALSSDPLNCGACGTTCGAGTACSAGVCTTTCPSGELACGGRCIDPRSDPTFCGATATCTDGVACGPSAACYAGRCEPLCAAGLVMCNGGCIDPLTDPGFCGASGYCSGAAAGATCAASWSCVAGACTPPPCSWVQLWQQSLASLPAGATARSGALGPWGFSTVGGRVAFTTTSDWAELLAPSNLAAADDTFAVQADFYATAVTLGTGGFRSTGLYALTDLYSSGQRHGLWAGFREQGGQATQFQWVVSPATLPASGWDGWDLDLAGISSLAKSSPAALPLGAWHTLRVEGVRSQCRFRALLDGVVVSTWTPATCDLAGASVAVAAARAQPLNVAWTNLGVSRGSYPNCVP